MISVARRMATRASRATAGAIATAPSKTASPRSKTGVMMHQLPQHSANAGPLRSRARARRVRRRLRRQHQGRALARHRAQGLAGARQPDPSRRLRLRSAHRRRRRHPDADSARVFRARSRAGSASNCRRRASTASGRSSCRSTPSKRNACRGDLRAASCARKGSGCSAGATCRWSRAHAATSRGAGCRRSARSSSAAARESPTPRRSSASSTSSASARPPKREHLGLSRCRELFYFCSLSAATDRLQGQLISTQIPRVLPRPARSRSSRPRWRWCISASPPTPSRAGTARIRTASCAHNGEINTLRGNINWMHAREKLFASPLFGDDMQEAAADHRARPAATRPCSTTASSCWSCTGRSLPHAMMMMIPEPWQNDEQMSDEQARVLRVPLLPDGAVGRPGLDRVHRRRAASAPCSIATACARRATSSPRTAWSSWRPRSACSTSRRSTSCTRAACSRAACSWSIPTQGRIVADEEIKRDDRQRAAVSRSGSTSNLVASRRRCPSRRPRRRSTSSRTTTCCKRQQAFGYTIEDLQDAPGADGGRTARSRSARWAPTRRSPCSRTSRSCCYNYFKQLFAQVTNPPIDAIREELVTSAETTIGSEQQPARADAAALPPASSSSSPILTNEELAKLKRLNVAGPAHDHAARRCSASPTAKPGLRARARRRCAAAPPPRSRTATRSSSCPTAA